MQLSLLEIALRRTTCDAVRTVEGRAPKSLAVGQRQLGSSAAAPIDLVIMGRVSESIAPAVEVTSLVAEAATAAID